MAPSYDNLPDEEEEAQIDFSDLNEQYEVRLEEGLDSFVVLDGLPKVPEDSKDKLTKFVVRKLNAAGKIVEDGFFMPVGDDGQTEGYAFVEYSSPAQATAAVKQLNGVALDKKHTMEANKLTDIEKYGREGRINEEYTEPTIPPFQQKEHLKWFIGDEAGRDQFAMLFGDNVGVYWNEKDEQPENIVDRLHWTESFVAWSPGGTFLASIHSRGVVVWGGPSWSRLKRFTHPGVNLIDYSPNEKYLTTWSHKPIPPNEEGDASLSPEEEGKNYLIWDIATGEVLRSFANVEQGPTTDEQGNPIKRKLQWPAFKWSSDDQYVARIVQGQSISIYELPRMNLLDKQSIKIEGVMDFEWCPAVPQRDSIRQYEQLMAYWQPELGSNPAKVSLLSVPGKEVVRTRNLFNVSDVKLHWQSQSAFLCVKVDRHSKSKKSLATNLEIFRVREKGVPVEVIDTIKEPVINFAWEPGNARLALITAPGEAIANSAVPPKTSVSFFCTEKTKAPNIIGSFKHIRTLDKRNTNALYWSPKGRFVIVGTIQSQQSHELEFFDFDYEGDKREEDEKLTANLQVIATADHFGVTDVEWSADGRFVATSASMWKHAMENGYHLYDFKGQLLREEHVDRFKQFSWRPRPPTLLTKEDQKAVRRNFKEYSQQFEEEDIMKKTSASRAVIEQRRRLLDEWLAWREQTMQSLRERREDEGLPPDPETANEVEDIEEGGEVVEEIVEEILTETEEVI